MKNLSKRELNEIIEEINTNLSEMVNDHEYKYLDQLDYNNEGDCWPNLELSDQDNDYISNNIHQLDDLVEERKERFEEEYENNKYIELAERLANQIENMETWLNDIVTDDISISFDFWKSWGRLRVGVTYEVFYNGMEDSEAVDVAIGFSKTRNAFDEDKFKQALNWRLYDGEDFDFEKGGW